jgi:NAD(P)-dependent dehydrogenase (short-subunit alcohol dehydrogenase family)
LRIAVTGAGGRLGGQVVRLLAAEQAHQVVVALTRREPPPERHLANARMVAADYADPAALRAALRGVEVLVFVSSDGEAARVLLHHQNVVRAAVDSWRGPRRRAERPRRRFVLTLLLRAHLRLHRADPLRLRLPGLHCPRLDFHGVLPALADCGTRHRPDPPYLYRPTTQVVRSFTRA